MAQPMEDRERDFVAVQKSAVDRLIGRIYELGKTPDDVAIILLDVDEPGGLGGVLANDLMPGADWQQYRELGLAPVARGLVGRAGLQALLDANDELSSAARAMREMPGEMVVFVVTNGRALVCGLTH